MKSRGFTLIETVLVLALAGFLVYGGAVSFRWLVPKFRLQTCVWEIQSALHQARFKAVWKGEPVRVRFVAGGYRLEAYSEETEAWRLDHAGILDGADVASNNDPAFYPEGTVANLATISVSNARGAYKITVAITGRIKTVKIG